MPQRGNLSTKGKQLLARYPRSINKKTSKPKIESRMDIIRKNPALFLLRKMLLKRGLTYSSSSSENSDFDLFDSPRRRSNPKLVNDSGSVDRAPPVWNLDDILEFDLDSYENPQSPVMIDETIDFDSSFDFGCLDLDSPRSSIENDNVSVNRENPQSNLNYDADADDRDSPRSVLSIYSDLLDSTQSSPRQTMDNNNNGSSDTDCSGRPSRNKADIDNTHSHTQDNVSFLNISLQERLADFSSDSDNEDAGYDVGSDIEQALEDIPYVDTDTGSSDSDSSHTPGVPQEMLSIPSSRSSSVLGYSKDFVNVENWRMDKPQYWDLMIKLIPSVKPRKYTYEYSDDDETDDEDNEEDDTPPAQEIEVEKPLVKVEASEEGYSLLKAFYNVVSETRASGEIVESDLDNSDVLKDLISRAAKMIIPEPEPESINDLSESEIEESFEGLPILYPVLARPGNFILYEFVPSTDTNQNTDKLWNAATDESTKTDDISMIEGRSLELTELMESCLSFPSLKLIRKGRGFMNPEDSVQIPGRTAELWPKFTFSHKMQDPTDKSRFAIKVRISYELVQLRPVLDLFMDCYRNRMDVWIVTDPNYVRKLSKELEGKHIFCKQIGEIFTIKKVHGKHSLIYNELGCENVTDFSTFLATVSIFSDKFGIPLEDFDFLQPLLECHSFDENSDEKPIFLLPQFCNLVGVRSEIGNGPDFYMEMFEVSTIQRHTARSRIREFMATFSKMPEVQNELKKWGIAFLGEYVKANEKTGSDPDIDIFSETQLPKKSSRSSNYALVSTCSSDDDAWEELLDKCFSALIPFRQ